MKKILPYIFIAILLLTLSYGCFGTHAANAQLIGWIENKAIEGIQTQIGNLILGLMSKAIFLAGMLLNASIAQTMNISGLVASIPSIELAWRTIRDVASMFFIFILLYAAVCNILNVGSIKKNILPAIIIAGLLMNFSMFFTKVIIDASNVVSLGFYKAIIAPGIEAANNNKDTSTIKGSITALSLMDGGLSQIFMQALKIQTVFDPKTGEGGADLGGDQYNKLTPKNVIVSTVMGSIVMLMAAFVFLAAACMFVVRTVVLVLLITLSPLAFLGKILPNTESFSNMWWKTLNDQAIFAPAYLMLTYIAMKVVTDPAFNRAINGNSADATFANAFMGAGNVGVILNYAIVIALLFATTIISKQFSGKAGEYGLKAAEMAKGWTTNKLKAAGVGTWRNTGGRAFSAIAESDRVKNFAANSVVGAAALKGIRGVASGYDKAVGDKTKKKEQFAESLGHDKGRVLEQERVLATHQTDLTTARQETAKRQKHLDDAKASGVATAYTLSVLEDNIKFAKQDEETAEGKVKTTKRQISTIKDARKTDYRDRLKGSLWTRTHASESNRAAAAKISIDLLKKDKERAETDLKETKADIKELEKDQKKATAAAPFTTAQQTELNDLYDKRNKGEEKIQGINVEIAEQEATL